MSAVGTDRGPYDSGMTAIVNELNEYVCVTDEGVKLLFPELHTCRSMTLGHLLIDYVLSGMGETESPGVSLEDLVMKSTYGRNTVQPRLSELSQEGIIERADRGWRVTHGSVDEALTEVVKPFND